MYVDGGTSISVKGGGRTTINGHHSTGPRFVQGNGKVVKRPHEVGAPFTSIETLGAENVTIRRGSVFSVSVIAEENIAPLLSAEVMGGALVLRTLRSYNSTRSVSVEVVMPTLEGINIRGAADIHVADSFAYSSLHVSLDGSGDLTARGTANRVSVDLRGSGDIKLGEVKAEVADVSLMGSGDVTVHASKEASVSLLGSGDVTVLGRPSRRRVSEQGSGEVRFP